MEAINQKDREILRSLAQKKLEYANSLKNEAIIKKWDALAHGRREIPTVRLLFSMFYNEVVTPLLQCTGETATGIEANLLHNLVGRELFDDDTLISATCDARWNTWVSPFGAKSNITWARGKMLRVITLIR